MIDKTDKQAARLENCHDRDRRGAPGFRVHAEVRTMVPTGVEMEALTAVSAACLTLFDMLKAIDKTMAIGAIRALSKHGGRSGSAA